MAYIKNKIKVGISMYYCVRNGQTFPNECPLQVCVDWALRTIVRFRETQRFCYVDICSAETGEVVLSLTTYSLLGLIEF